MVFVSDEVFPYKPGKSRVPLPGTRFSVMSDFEIAMSADYADCPFDLELGAEYLASDEEWVATYVKAKQQIDGPAVTTEGLRDVAIGFAIRQATHAIPDLVQDDQGQNYRDIWDGLRAQLRANRMTGPTPANLASVAEVYRVSKVLGDPPVLAVQFMFDLPDRSASHWVKLSRERGHFDLETGEK